MAEFVEKNIEETIPEVEEMERIGLLSSKEVKKLIQTRRDFHYRLVRKSKNKADYINYVNYERKVIDLVKIRRKQIGIREKSKQIETAICKRVMKMLRYLTRVWPSHLDTWKLRTSFAQHIGWKDEIGFAFAEQIRYHGNRENVWVAWAKWEIEERENFDKARKILLSTAQLYHPKSHFIKRELFRLELLYVESLMNKMKNGNNTGLEEIIAKNRDKVLNCAVAKAVYQNAVTSLPDPELYLQLYQVADKHKFAHTLRDEIYRDVCVKFPNTAGVWKLKAQRMAFGLTLVECEGHENDVTTGRNKEVADRKVNKENMDSYEKEEEDIAVDTDNEEEAVETEKCSKEYKTKSEDLRESDENDSEASVGDDGSDSEDDMDKTESNKKASNVNDILHTDQTIEKVVSDMKTENAIDNKVDIPNLPRNMSPMGMLECIILAFDEATRVIGGSFLNTYIEELLPLLYQCWGAADMTDLIFKKLISFSETHTDVLSPLSFFVLCQVMCEMSLPINDIQSVLEEAIKCHPEVAHLRLKFVQLIIRKLSNKQMMEEFNKVAASIKGDCGLQAWLVMTKHMTNDSLRTKIFLQALDHEDTTVSQGMRVQYLKETGLQRGIESTRKLYQKLCWRPPFTAKLHALMVELELAQIKINVENIRNIFNNALQQHGTKHPGVWLAYIQFEKHHGDPLKAGGLFTRAEKELEAKEAHLFREFNISIRELLEEGTAAFSDDQGQSILIEKVSYEDMEEDGHLCKPALVTLFKEELILLHSADQARKKFFSSINTMEKQLNEGNANAAKEDGSEWEQVLQSLIGHKVVLSVQKVEVKHLAPESSISMESKMIVPRFKNRHQATDELKLEVEDSVQTERENHITKILKSCAVLKPEFMQETHVSPYFIGKKKAKEQCRREREKTKGPGWFNMKAPELTEEVKRDLEVLQMRSVLDPKRHFKSTDMKVLPKYFHLGRVVDNPIEFYSSRIPKKERKRTLAEEIIHDEEALRYQKRKYTEIIAAKHKKLLRHQEQHKKTDKKAHKKADKSKSK